MGSLASIVRDDRNFLEVALASCGVLENEMYVWSLGVSESHLLCCESVDNMDRLMDG